MGERVSGVRQDLVAVHRRDGLTHVMELFIDLVRNVVALRA